MPETHTHLRQSFQVFKRDEGYCFSIPLSTGAYEDGFFRTAQAAMVEARALLDAILV